MNPKETQEEIEGNREKRHIEDTLKVQPYNEKEITNVYDNPVSAAFKIESAPLHIDRQARDPVRAGVVMETPTPALHRTASAWLCRIPEKALN